MKHDERTPSGISDQEEEQIYIGDFIMRAHYLLKENYEKTVLMEAKMSIMTDVMMNLRDVIQSYLEIDNHSDKAN